MRYFFALLFLFGCARQETPPRTDPRLEELKHSIAQISAQEAEDKKEIAELQVSAELLVAQIQLLTKEWEEIDKDFKQAKNLYELAQANSDVASASFLKAKDDFDTAAERYRQVVWVLIAAASWDMAGEVVCQGTMSTRQFRQQLKRQGIDLTGLDIDHAWPKALGGIDHPLNYQPLDASLNRSLGADVAAKFVEFPGATLEGFAVSALSVLRCN